MTTTPATPRTGEEWLRYRFSQWEYGSEWVAALDEALAADRDAHDALLAALRALVDNAGHYSVPGFVAAIEQARALLRDLSPEGEGQ